MRAFAGAGYHVRALTRSPSRPETIAQFASLGDNVEPFAFDINDQASMFRAFTGADVVFAVTVPEDDALMAAEGSSAAQRKGLTETEQGILLAQTAKTTGVGLFVL